MFSQFMDPKCEGLRSIFQNAQTDLFFYNSCKILLPNNLEIDPVYPDDIKFFGYVVNKPQLLEFWFIVRKLTFESKP